MLIPDATMVGKTVGNWIPDLPDFGRVGVEAALPEFIDNIEEQYPQP